MLLYYITDRSGFPGPERNRRAALLEKIAAAARAGVDYIQLREKDLSPRELEALSQDALSAIRQARPPTTRLLINSRADIALAAGAGGVHLRADDPSPDDIRQIGPAAAKGSFLVARSCHTRDDVTAAAASRADFCVFAPVFEKKDAPAARPAGVALLRQACRASIPVLALGGVTLDNARSCVEAGAAGIAAIRLFQEHDIAKVVRLLRG